MEIYLAGMDVNRSDTIINPRLDDELVQVDAVGDKRSADEADFCESSRSWTGDIGIR